LPDIETNQLLKNVTKIDELWPVLVENLKTTNTAVDTINQVISRHVIPGINYHKAGVEELIHTLNVTRTLLNARDRYMPTGKIKTRVHYIEASDSREMIKRGWDGYCVLPIRYYTVSGDHFSIFRKPYVEGLAREFQEALEKAWEKRKKP
jgi:thioesterase domain-containing protein